MLSGDLCFSLLQVIADDNGTNNIITHQICCGHVYSDTRNSIASVLEYIASVVAVSHSCERQLRASLFACLIQNASFSSKFVAHRYSADMIT